MTELFNLLPADAIIAGNYCIYLYLIIILQIIFKINDYFHLQLAFLYAMLLSN